MTTSEFSPIHVKYEAIRVKPPGNPKVHPNGEMKAAIPICVVIPSASRMVNGPPKSPAQTLVFVPSMHKVLDEAELGKRKRQAFCEMIGAVDTLKFLIGDESPVPVVPQPEKRANCPRNSCSA